MFARIIQGYRRWSDRNGDIAAFPCLLIVVVVVLSVSTGGRFLNASNILNLAIQIPELGLLSLAMMVAMLTAGINLSIISSANLSAVVMDLVLTHLASEGSGAGAVVFWVCVAILLGLFVSMILGALNGFLIAYAEVPTVLTTLGTIILFEGITLAITRRFVISGLPEGFLVIGNARFLGILLQMYIFVFVVGLLMLIMKKRPYGTYLYMLGSNPTATRFSGVDVRRTLLKTYVLSRMLAGIAVIIMLSRFNSANACQGSFLLLLTVLSMYVGRDGSFWRFWKNIWTRYCVGGVANGDQWFEFIRNTFFCNSCHMGLAVDRYYDLPIFTTVSLGTKRKERKLSTIYKIRCK